MNRLHLGGSLLGAGVVFVLGSMMQVARGRSEIVMLVLAGACISLGIKNLWRYHRDRLQSTRMKRMSANDG